jgi:LPXTG-motif cell wall-anchored protein
VRELRGSSWRTLGTALLLDQGRYAFVVWPTGAGTHRCRVVMPRPDDPALRAESAVVLVRVPAAGGSDGGGDVLPVTGPAAGPLAAGAGALILLGIGLVLVGRRRPRGNR